MFPDSIALAVVVDVVVAGVVVELKRRSPEATMEIFDLAFAFFDELI